jgi:hypothetical protein
MEIQMKHTVVRSTVVITLLATLAIGQAFADVLSPKVPTALGPQIGFFLPTDSKTRDRFGSTWLSIGAKMGTNQYIGPKGRTGFDVSFLYQKSGSNHAWLLPVGVSYRRAMGATTTMTPYVGAAANLVISDIRSDGDDIHSRIRTVPGGSVFTGINLGTRAYIEARYLLVSKIRALDMSGVNLSVGITF